LTFFTSASLIALSSPAWAYRPFDGTDAAVAAPGEVGRAETVSVLIGAIWRVRDDLSFDIGLRRALTNGHPVDEVRAGLTFSFQSVFDHHALQTR
jgi:hypothetical protein